MKEQLEMTGTSLGWILRELGESILKMRKCQAKSLIVPKLHSIKSELRLLISLIQTTQWLEPDDHFATASLVFLLMEIAAKTQILAEKVEDFGELASFRLKTQSLVYLVSPF